MILLRVSVFFLLYGIICCQESVNIAPTGETTPHQEPVKPNSKPEDKEEKSEDTQGGISEPQRTPAPTSDIQQFVARRRRCCDDGRQHFYMNGNCANRPREANEAVGLWCDRKFLECCNFMEAYYAGPVEGCRHKNKNCASQLPSPTDSVPNSEINGKVTPKDDKPQEPAEPTSKPENKEEKSVQSEDTQGGIREPQPTPVPTSDQQFVARRRRCCDDGRQHFYMNGNCENRSREANEAVGLWCDRKFLQCCNFMEAYYGGPVEGCRHKDKNCSSRLPSPTDSELNSQTNGKVTAVDDKPQEPARKPENKEEKLAQSEDTQGANHDPQTTPDPMPDIQQFVASRRRCCDDGRQHFYKNGNCDNRPREANEAVGLWCDRKFLECCNFMEAYYAGPVEGCRHKDKNCASQLPSPTDSVPNSEINQKVIPIDDKPQ